jgi:hypothetical protein
VADRHRGVRCHRQPATFSHPSVLSVDVKQQHGAASSRRGWVDQRPGARTWASLWLTCDPAGTGREVSAVAVARGSSSLYIVRDLPTDPPAASLASLVAAVALQVSFLVSRVCQERPMLAPRSLNGRPAALGAAVGIGYRTMR